MKHYQYRLWFIISIVASILFSIAGLKLAFQDPYTIQDDARQHIFWMQQFRDNTLLNNDLIADYFRSVAPEGFITLYRLVSSLGIDIFFFNKISPLLISLVASIYCFGVCLEIFSIPFAGFLSTLLLNQNLWMLDDLSSGTPRAFLYPLLLAFIYYLLHNSLWLCLLTIVLQGLFYPQTVLISAAILLIRLISHAKRSDPALCGAVSFRAAIRRKGTLTEQRRKERQRVAITLSNDYRKINQKTVYLLGLIISFIILTLYSLKTSTYEPIVFCCGSFIRDSADSRSILSSACCNNC